MAIIRQKISGTGEPNRAETGVREKGQTKRIVRKSPVLASKLNRTSLARQRRNANAKESVRAGQRNLREERNLRKERKEREVSGSQMMYWLKRRNENAAEDRQLFFPPRQRYMIIKIERPRGTS